MRDCFTSFVAFALLASTPAIADEIGAALNASNERMASCDIDAIRKASDGFLNISWRDQIPLCEMARTSMGHLPEVGVYHTLLVSAFVVGHNRGEATQEVAYQMLGVTEARQSDTPDKMKSTFDLLYRVNAVTSGHVSPKDINVFLRNSGDMAHTLSDEGLSNMAFVIWEEKKKDGE